MAIGDSWGEFVGSGAAGNHQPASGVEEQVTAIVKPFGTGVVRIYNGSTQLDFIDTGVITQVAHDATGDTQQDLFNTFIMISNTNYLRMPSAGDAIYVGGVTTNV